MFIGHVQSPLIVLEGGGRELATPRKKRVIGKRI